MIFCFAFFFNPILHHLNQVHFQFIIYEVYLGLRHLKGSHPLRSVFFDFVKFIGSYASIVDQFADTFEVQTNKNQQENIFIKFLIYIIKILDESRFYYYVFCFIIII